MKVLQLAFCFVTMLFMQSIANVSTNSFFKDVNTKQLKYDANIKSSSFEEPKPKENPTWNAAPKRGKPIRGHGN